jgi:hypothetical protein
MFRIEDDSKKNPFLVDSSSAHSTRGCKEKTADKKAARPSEGGAVDVTIENMSTLPRAGDVLLVAPTLIGV